MAIGFVAAEPIETFTSAVLNNISTSVATAAGVDPGNVIVTASAASTRIDIIITTPSATASTNIEENMAATMFSDASTASSVLGLTVTSAPTITSQTVLTITPPAMSAGLSVPDAGSGTMLTVLIAVGAGSLLGGIAAIMLVIRCRRRRTKSVGPTPADERGVATHGIELEEDVDIVKADRPVRQADAAVRLARDREAEATIDFVKKDNPVAPASASIASALTSSSSAASIAPPALPLASVAPPALPPSAQLRRADAVGQAGATAAPTLISATYCAPTDTSATYCASTHTSATSIAPTYSSATLPEGWNSKDSFLTVMANQMPNAFTEQMAQQVTQRIRSQLPTGTAFDEYYPKVVVSHATGRRRDPSVARSAWTAKVGWSDCAGAGPGMFYAAGFLEVLHQCGLQCFSGLHVPAGVDWEVFMLRLKGRHAKAKVLIVLKTKSFYESAPCLKELSCAIDKKIPVIPIVLEENLPGPKQQWSKLTDQDSEVMIAKVQEHLGKINDIPSPGTLLTVPEALDEILEEINKHVPFKERAVASAGPDPVPALALRYAVGSSVFMKRSNGAETLAYVKEYDAEMALYTVEIDTLGSGKTEKCHDKDLRAANVGLIEGLIGSARAALLTLQAGGSLAA